MIEGSCRLARRIADRLSADAAVRILNDVVLNQVLVRFEAGAGAGRSAEDDAFTQRVIAAVQRDGTAWAGGTTWHGLAAMRISVSGWNTSEADADRTSDAILRCAHKELPG